VIQMKVTEHPELTPAACSRCSAGDTLNQLGQRMRAYFLDTGVEMEVEGRFYLCNMCLNDVAEIVPDWFSKTVYQA